MIKIVTNEERIHKLQKIFQESLNRYFNEEIECKVGFQGESNKTTVRYSSILDMWYFSKAAETRYWNAFGDRLPDKAKSNSIIGEINFPYKDLDRRVSGCFGMNNESVYALHRGKINSKNGISKQFFKDNFHGEFINAEDGENESELFVIGDILLDSFPNQVRDFICAIKHVKSISK